MTIIRDKKSTMMMGMTPIAPILLEEVGHPLILMATQMGGMPMSEAITTEEMDLDLREIHLSTSMVIKAKPWTSWWPLSDL
jgi:hypothetical protein